MRGFLFGVLVSSCVLATWVENAYAIEPFFVYEILSMVVGQGNANATIQVPPNKMWVIESVSGRIELPTGQHILNLLLFGQPGPSPQPLYFVPTLIAQRAPIGPNQFADIYQFNHATRGYYSGNVIIYFERAEGLETATMGFAAQGYLVPALNGDFNADGAVDAADYVTYRNSLGQMGVGNFADGNGDSLVEPGDYGVWRRNYGRTSASPAAAASPLAVPEPAAMLMVAIACLAVCCCRVR